MEGELVMMLSIAENSVGDFYEAIGIDACILVEYAGLNPFGGLRSDSIPRAGCPVMLVDGNQLILSFRLCVQWQNRSMEAS
ncbi:DNA mismatch repair ATPase msh1 [Sarracenia purpurea var. burkii]